jgi:hypothetical protein
MARDAVGIVISAVVHPGLMMADEVLRGVIERMRQFAYVRDRHHEREPRVITITDEEAAELLAALGALLNGLAELKRDE